MNKNIYDFSKDYYLLWHDEFDGKKLDETKWNIVHGNFRVNNEAQRYTDGLNIELKDSCLVLWAKKNNLRVWNILQLELILEVKVTLLMEELKFVRNYHEEEVLGQLYG